MILSHVITVLLHNPQLCYELLEEEKLYKDLVNFLLLFRVVVLKEYNFFV